jgi:ferrous iron transport protein B
MAKHCGSLDPKKSAEVDSRATIALVGNPNCGKTTLFNLLTGMQQSVGNWPGVTVERHAGVARLDSQTRVAVIDLPGIYSLLGGGGEDQAVARHFLRDEAADLIVQVLDASNLERHLLLTADTVLREIKQSQILGRTISRI